MSVSNCHLRAAEHATLGKVSGLLTVQALQSHHLMTCCGAASGGPWLQTAVWSHPKGQSVPFRCAPCPVCMFPATVGVKAS